MPVVEPPLIITAQDVRLNCFSATSKKVVVTPEIHQIESDYVWPVETDCLHPDSSFLLEQLTPCFEQTTLYLTPKLHADQLSENWTLVFNPLGRAGVVVLNQPALALLDKFRHAQSLMEGVQTTNDPMNSLSIVRQLVNLEILEPVDSCRDQNLLQHKH